MSDTPLPVDEELNSEGADESAERALGSQLAPPKPTAPGGSLDPQPLPDNGGMTPDQDAIGSG
jgi:hypothetical protein